MILSVLEKETVAYIWFMALNVKRSPNYVPGSMNMLVRGTGGGFKTKSLSSTPSIVLSGLVLYLDAGNPSSYPGSGTTWTDLSGQGNDATLTNGPIFDTESGGCFVFDGVDDYAPLSTNGFPFGSSPVTLSVWARLAETGSTYNWIFAYGSPSFGAARFLGRFGNTCYFGGYAQDITVTLAPGAPWFNLVGVYDGSNVSIYVDGALVAGPSAISWNAIPSQSALGRQVNGGEYWRGKTAQVLVYDRALTSAEILENFNVTKSRYLPNVALSGLVLYLEAGNLDSYPGSGTTLTDLMGSSDATLYNSPTYSSGYLQFDGNNQYLVTNTSLGSKVSSDVTTLSIWAYPMDNGVILAELGTPNLNTGWHDSQMEMVGGTMKFRFWDGTGSSILTSTIPTPLNAWYNFTILHDGTSLFAYVNGQSAGSITFSRQNPIEFGQGLYYGIAGNDSTDLGDGSYANMRFGEFFVYNRALTLEEIQQNFNNTKSKYGL